MRVFRRLAASLLLTLIFLPCLALQAQEEAPPFVDPETKGVGEGFDAFAEISKLEDLRSEQGEPRLTLLIEFIQLPQRDWARLSRDETLEDDTAIRKAIETMLNSDHASLLDMSLISTTNSESFKGESYQFRLFPATFESPEIDEKNDRIVPVSFSSSECWNSGFTAQGEMTLSADFSEIHLNVVPEYVGLSGQSEFGKQESKVELPTFTVHKLYSDLVAKPGTFVLAGIFQAHKADHPDRGKDLVAVFLRPTLQVVPVGEPTDP